jgi:hypothetical protein
MGIESNIDHSNVGATEKPKSEAKTAIVFCSVCGCSNKQHKTEKTKKKNYK